MIKQLRAGHRDRRREAPANRTFKSHTKGIDKMARSISKQVIRAQATTFADWFAELRDLAGNRWPGGATPDQALYMITAILPKAA
jgi:hypothetical protein